MIFYSFASINYSISQAVDLVEIYLAYPLLARASQIRYVLLLYYFYGTRCWLYELLTIILLPQYTYMGVCA